MKKVSFERGLQYYKSDIPDITPEDLFKYFGDIPLSNRMYCKKSFTAEITVKILPYEES